MLELAKKIRKVIRPTWFDLWGKTRAELQGAKVLHIGCGRDVIPGAVRLDISPSVKPDVLWNLTSFPYPFDDSTFDFVVAHSIIEHLSDTLGVMGEIHRILKPGGRCIVLCPHFSSRSAMIDPTHKRLMSASTFDYFIKGTELERQYGFYVNYRYTLRQRHVELVGLWAFLPMATRIISRSPNFWERHLCYIVRGSGLYWDLEAAK